MSLVFGSRTPVSRYRPAARGEPPLREPPLPPLWSYREPDVAKSPLLRFMVLSMLLHALAIVLFGAPSGGSKEGRAMFGTLNVMLGSAPPEPMPELKLDRGSSPTLLPLAVPRTAERRADADASTPAAPVSADAAPEVVPHLLDRLSVPDREARVPIVPLATDLQVHAAPPAPPPRVEPPMEAPALRLAVPAPIAAPVPSSSPAPVELREAPRMERPLPRFDVPQPLEAPLPAPGRLPELREAPRLERPMPQLDVPSAIAPPASAAPLAAPELRAAPRLERPIPEVRADPIPSRVEPSAHTSSALPERPASRLEPAPRIERDLPREAAASIGPAPPPPAPRAPRPAAGDFPSGRDASGYDPTAAPKLDGDALRRRAGQLAREGSGQRALLPFPMPPVPEKKSKMEELIEKARKPDCRDAYKHLGLAAVVPLIANEFGEGKCRW